jgi:pyridoxine 5-phosphate synthase
LRLYVNIDHVATVRQARRTDEPDPVRVAVLAEQGGADGITVHLREDRRHIQDRDVELLMRTVRTGVNLELAAVGEILDIACRLKPMQATLVPERREEITTEGGLDLAPARLADVRSALERLKGVGVRTSLFIDPDAGAVEHSHDLGADAVELHTGEFAHARTPAARRAQVERLARAAERGRSLGIAVHAGHGLTYENVAHIAHIDEIEELNIGHSIVSRALFSGMEEAVREMARILRRARRGE